MVETRCPKTPKTFEKTPDEQSQEPQKSGKNKSWKKNAEQLESDHKNGGKLEADQKNLDKLEAMEANGNKSTADDENLGNLAKNGEKLMSEDINGEDLKIEQRNRKALKTQQQHGEDFKNEQKNGEGLKSEPEKSMAEQDEVDAEPKTAMSERKSAKKAKHPSKLGKNANSEEVSADTLNEVQKQLDLVEEKHKQIDIVEEQTQLDNFGGNEKQLGEVEVEQNLEENEIVGLKHLVETGVEEKNGEEVEGEDKQINAVEGSTQNETPKKKMKRKSSARPEAEQVYVEKVEDEVQGLQKEGSGEKEISGLEPINAEVLEGRAEQKIVVEMNSDSGKPMKKKLEIDCKEKKLQRDEDKVKIDQGISEIDRVEMGQDGAKENSHVVESKRECQKNKGMKRKNQNIHKEEGTDKRSGEGQTVNGEKESESKGMEAETDAKKKQTAYISKEINNIVEMNIDSEKPMSKKMTKYREFIQRCKEKQLQSKAEKLKIEQGISEVDKVDMGQKGAKENSLKVKSKQENEKKRGQKRKNQNIQQEEGANKSSGEGQMVNGEKGAESKRMEAETNAMKKQTTYTNKEISNFVEMNTDGEKPMSKKMKRSHEFMQRWREKKMQRKAEKLKIEQGISEVDKVEMGQEGAKENSHKVESKQENEKKRGQKRKNKNRQKEEGANKSSGEGQMVNGEKGAESKGMEAETNAKKKQNTYTNKEINNFVEMNSNSEKPMSKKMKRSHEFMQRWREKKMQRKAEKLKIEQGISEVDKVEMGQEGAKENSHKVESKRENEKKRSQKRKNKNRQKEEGGMEGDTNAKKKQTAYTSKKINNFVEINADSGKPLGKKSKVKKPKAEEPMGRKLTKARNFFQRCKEKKAQTNAENKRLLSGDLGGHFGQHETYHWLGQPHFQGV